MPNETTRIEPADDNPRPVEDEESTGETQEPQEPVEREPEKQEPPKEEPKETPQEAEDDDGFKEFLKDNELPESFETPEELAKAYKEVLRQFKTEQTDRGQEGRQEALPREEPSQQKSYFNTTAASAHVKTMEESGLFGDNKELAQSYKAIAKVIDTAYGAELTKADEVMTTMFIELKNLRDRVLEMQWNGVNPEVRKRVKRDEVDRLMRDHKFADYDSAVRFYAMTRDPAIFKLFQQQQNPQNPNQNKKRFRWGARGGVQQPYESQEWKKYVNLDGSVNARKLDTLPKKQGDKILDDIIRAQSRNR